MKASAIGASLTFAALGFLATSTNAFAESPLDGYAPSSTINACVAEIDDRANLEGATRIRHVVEAKKRRSIGHKLKIDSTLYDDAAGKVLREYASVCVVTRGNVPYRFEIEEVGDDS